MTTDYATLQVQALTEFAVDNDKAKLDRALAGINAMIAAEAARDSRRAGPCPITEDEFARYHPQLTLNVFGKTVKTVAKYGDPRPNKSGGESGGRFSAGSFGYWIGGRVDVEINGKTVPFQMTGNLVAVNSR